MNDTSLCCQESGLEASSWAPPETPTAVRAGGLHGWADVPQPSFRDSKELFAETFANAPLSRARCRPGQMMGPEHLI